MEAGSVEVKTPLKIESGNNDENISNSAPNNSNPLAIVIDDKQEIVDKKNAGNSEVLNSKNFQNATSPISVVKIVNATLTKPLTPKQAPPIVPMKTVAPAAYFGFNVPLSEAVSKFKPTSSIITTTSARNHTSNADTMSSSPASTTTAAKTNTKPMIKNKGKSINFIANRLQEQKTKLFANGTPSFNDIPSPPPLTSSQLMMSPTKMTPNLQFNNNNKQNNDRRSSSDNQMQRLNKSPFQRNTSDNSAVNSSLRPNLNILCNKPLNSPSPRNATRQFTTHDPMLISQTQQLAELRKQRQILDNLAAAVANRNNLSSKKKVSRGRPHGQQNQNYAKSNSGANTYNTMFNTTPKPSVFGHYKIAGNKNGIGETSANSKNTKIAPHPKYTPNKLSNGAVWRAMSTSDDVTPMHTDFFGRIRPAPPPNVTMTSYNNDMHRPKIDDIYQSCIQKAKDEVKQMDKVKHTRAPPRSHPFSKPFKQFVPKMKTYIGVPQRPPRYPTHSAPKPIAPKPEVALPHKTITLQRPHVNTRWMTPNSSTGYNNMPKPPPYVPPVKRKTPDVQQPPVSSSDFPEQDQPLCLVVRK